jgi:hypothetical protein
MILRLCSEHATIRCSKELPNDEPSVATNDDSSNAAGFIIFLSQDATG